MKCGIFTFSGAPNYGASLQAYALKKTIESFGCECVVVNYITGGNANFEPADKERYINDNASLHYRILYSLFAKAPYRKKMDRFKKFWEIEMDRVEYEDGIQNQLDVVICGSDQIWNPKITKGYDPIFFAKDASRSFSYAASVGDMDNIRNNGEVEFLKLLNNFDYISVREEELYKYLRDKGFDNAELVIDPTLLLGRKVYEKLLSETGEEANTDVKPYLCVYQLKRYPYVSKVAKKIAKERKLDILEISGCDNIFFNKRINNAGPLEFIRLIKDAKYVVTNSYHGTLFSLIFHKDFNVVYSNTGNSRISTILKLVGLENRIADGISKYSTEKINYILVDAKIKALRDKALKFITKALIQYE